MTISLGVEADTATMQAVADGTGGKHYNVPGGTDHTDDARPSSMPRSRRSPRPGRMKLVN